MRCLRAAQLYFQTMVRVRLKIFAPGRLNAQRGARLPSDNPELRLMYDLAEGMKVHLPDRFTPNGPVPRSARRKIYETVSTAVNKMLRGHSLATAGVLAALVCLTYIYARNTGQRRRESRPGVHWGT